MRPGCLHTSDGMEIPVDIRTSETSTLLECHDAGALLRHLTAGRCAPCLSPDTYIRGVVIQGEGAFFQLRDQFGIVADDVVHLSEDEACALLLERIW